MTEQQAKALDKLSADFAPVCLVVFDSAGNQLHQAGSVTTPWCQRMLSGALGSKLEAAKTFQRWMRGPSPAGGGAGDEACTFYRPGPHMMVAALFTGLVRSELGQKSTALGERLITILGAQPSGSSQ
jgi:hypothetical protein